MESISNQPVPAISQELEATNGTSESPRNDTDMAYEVPDILLGDPSMYTFLSPFIFRIDTDSKKRKSPYQSSRRRMRLIWNHDGL
jgi:hypothetical protein